MNSLNFEASRPQETKKMEEEFEVDLEKLFEKIERDGLDVSEGSKVHKCLSIKGGHIE